MIGQFLKAYGLLFYYLCGVSKNLAFYNFPATLSANSRLGFIVSRLQNYLFERGYKRAKFRLSKPIGDEGCSNYFEKCFHLRIVTFRISIGKPRCLITVYFIFSIDSVEVFTIMSHNKTKSKLKFPSHNFEAQVRIGTLLYH